MWASRTDAKGAVTFITTPLVRRLAIRIGAVVGPEERRVHKVPTPTLIICGDEDDNCIEPSLFLKQHLPAAGLTFFPKTGHVLNLEEPALFNEMVGRFIELAEAGRWPVRDPRSMAAG